MPTRHDVGSHHAHLDVRAIAHPYIKSLAILFGCPLCLYTPSCVTGHFWSGDLRCKLFILNTPRDSTSSVQNRNLEPFRHVRSSRRA